MLKHETETVPEYQSPSQPAAHVRVTPEELAAAIASVEARKEQVADTISLGDAVHELNLNATPEELLAAVEARRRAAQQQAALKSNTKHSRGQATKVLTGLVVGFTLMIMLLGFLFSARSVSVAPALAASTHIEMTLPSAKALPILDFQSFMTTLQTFSFDKNRLECIASLARDSMFTTDQVHQILRLFAFDNERETAAVFLYPRTLDKGNFHQVLDTFSFDDNRSNVLRRIQQY